MQNRIDSSIVEYNEDGSQTITTIEHYTPPTKAQTALAWTGVTALMFAPVIVMGICRRVRDLARQARSPQGRQEAQGRLTVRDRNHLHR